MKIKSSSIAIGSAIAMFSWQYGWADGARYYSEPPTSEVVAGALFPGGGGGTRSIHTGNTSAKRSDTRSIHDSGSASHVPMSSGDVPELDVSSDSSGSNNSKSADSGGAPSPIALGMQFNNRHPSEIGEEQKAFLDPIGKAIQASSSSTSTFRIEVRSSKTASISHAQAAAVKNYLMKTYGIASNRLEVAGAGASDTVIFQRTDH